jgi:hypothetical protein
MTELTPADHAFQDACVEYLKAGCEAGDSPPQVFYDAIGCLASSFAAAAAAPDVELEHIRAMTAGMLRAANAAILDLMGEATKVNVEASLEQILKERDNAQG